MINKILIFVVLLSSNFFYSQELNQKVIVTYNNCSKVKISKSSDAKMSVENYLFTWGKKTNEKQLKPYKDSNGIWKINIKIRASNNFNKLNCLYINEEGTLPTKLSKSELFSPNNIIIHSSDFSYYDDSLYLLFEEKKEVYLVNLYDFENDLYTIKKAIIN